MFLSFTHFHFPTIYRTCEAKGCLHDYCIIWIVSPGAYFQKGGLDELLAHSLHYVLLEIHCKGELTFEGGLLSQGGLLSRLYSIYRKVNEDTYSVFSCQKEYWALSINICPWSFLRTTGVRASPHPYMILVWVSFLNPVPVWGVDGYIPLQCILFNWFGPISQ